MEKLTIFSHVNREMLAEEMFDYILKGHRIRAITRIRSVINGHGFKPAENYVNKFLPEREKIYSFDDLLRAAISIRNDISERAATRTCSGCVIFEEEKRRCEFVTKDPMAMLAYCFPCLTCVRNTRRKLVDHYLKNKGNVNEQL
jgi:hypothetical protein